MRMTTSVNSKINYSYCPSSNINIQRKKIPQETPAIFPSSPEVYDFNNSIKKWISQDWRISDSQKNGRNRLVKTILTKDN